MPSASTLIRQAKKAKTKKEETRLRKEAANLRRLQRVKSKIVKRAGQPAPPASKSAAVRALKDVAQNEPEVANYARQASAGGAIGGWKEVETDSIFLSDGEITRLRKLARDHRNPDYFEIALRGNLVNARHVGERKRDEQHTERLKTVYEANRIAVVSGFIAEMNAVAKWHGGPMPAAVVLSGHTLARVLEALRDAGYTESGKEGMRRRG